MNSATSIKHKISVNFMAYLLSAAINLGLFTLLSNLNGAPRFDSEQPLKATLSFTLFEQTQLHQSEQRSQQDPLPEPELMTVDLDLIEVQPIPLEPIPLDLFIPNPSEHSVAVAPALTGPGSKTQSIQNNDKPQVTENSAGRVDEPPRELTDIRPEYPKVALSSGTEGWVEARLLINESGRVEDIQILQVEGHPAFRNAVLDAARKWKFKPARHGGTLVKVWGVKRIRFDLEDA